MKTLYSDASFDWNTTDKTTENVVYGRTAVVGEGISVVEKVVIGKVPGLKQYTNILELVAIARAIELASERMWDEPLEINTDSQVAKTWATKGIKPKTATEAHQNALEYLSKAKRMYYLGDITINYVPRERNLAGHLLEDSPKDKSVL